MGKQVFNTNDAHKAMVNLTTPQANQWARIANKEVQKFLVKGANPTMASRRAIQLACEWMNNKANTIVGDQREEG